MKPTPRRSGRHMFTLKSEHCLDSLDVATILAKNAEADWEQDQIVLPTLSRAATEKIIRAALAAHGDEGYCFWSDEMEPAEADARARWAAATVRRLWPELNDNELARFESSHNQSQHRKE